MMVLQKQQQDLNAYLNMVFEFTINLINFRDINQNKKNIIIQNQMSSSTSSVSNSGLFSQSTLNSIQTYYDIELEQEELEAEKEIFAQMFEVNYNTTNLSIQVMEESFILRKTNKLRMLKRKLHKLMRVQKSGRKVVEIQRKEEAQIGIRQFNQFKYYENQEGQYYDVGGNKNQNINNFNYQAMKEPIIKPDISIISSISTQHSASQPNIYNINDINNIKNTNIDININLINNNDQINNTNNDQCEGIVQNAFEQHDPNEQFQQHQQK
ncbi:unnamed protein product [Paramecium sonneborni]|uniref:Uncharacterized protein n=1 Tax=Paramecium sonneborni TaxID=65129 RepID=A0A8S1Q4L5_9CILI|nr:unnamed protein product [Paramecium sonneborni]